MGWLKEQWEDVEEWATGEGSLGYKTIYDDLSGKTSAEAAQQAAATEAGAMTDQLEYLQEVNRLPQQYRDQALTELASIYGLGGAAQSQQRQPSFGLPSSGMAGAEVNPLMDAGKMAAGTVGGGAPGSGEVQPQNAQLAMIERVKASPMYQEIMAGREAGEEAVMRNAAQTGGLRSGNVQSAMYDYNTQLGNQALTQGYAQQMAGLQGLAGIPTGSQQIGQTMANIGRTQAQGILGGAQAQQAGTQNLMNLGFGVAGLFI